MQKLRFKRGIKPRHSKEVKLIYGAEEEDDWTEPKVWKKANPSLGITVGIDKVKAACESSKQNSAEENSFRQLRINQWVKQAVRWMTMEKWDKCAFKVDPERLKGRVCYGGLDLSSTTDITAFVLVFPPADEDDKFHILPFFWIPEDNSVRRLIYTTNTIEGFHRQLRKVTKTKTAYPTDDALRKINILPEDGYV